VNSWGSRGGGDRTQQALLDLLAAKYPDALGN